MGIRLRVWAIAALGVVAIALVALWGRGGGGISAASVSSVAGPAMAAAKPPRAVPAPRVQPRGGEPVAATRAAPPLAEGGEVLVERSRSAAARGGASGGVAGTPPRQRATAPPEQRLAAGAGAAPRAPATAPPVEASDLESDAARLAEELELPTDELVEALDPQDFDSYDDLETAAAANAVILEYRMELELGGGVPSDYPVDARRAAIVQEIANLSPRQRERWLRESRDGLAHLRPDEAP